MKKIYSYLNSLHKKCFTSEFPFKPGQAKSFEELMELNSVLEDLSITDGKIIEFIKDQTYERIIENLLQKKS